MSFLGILGAVFLLLVLFCVYRLLVSYKPVIHMNEKSECAPIVAQMKTLNRRYKPTPWLINPNLHTIWGMRYRPTSRFQCRREPFKFEDNGSTILDWFEPADAKEDTPIVVIIHTLAGGTREPCTNNMAMTVMKRGWRAVVANCRACSGAPITSERLYSGIQIDDMQAIVKHIQTVFKPKYTFMVGFSLGATQTTFYSISESNIDAYALVSHVYSSSESCMMLEKPVQRKLYLPVILYKLIHAVKKNPFISDEVKKDVQRVKTLCEFDDVFTAKNLGFKNHEDYYAVLALRDKVDKVKAPMLVLASDDDPFTTARVQPRKEIEASKNVVMVRFKEGGHVSFNYGMDGKRSVADTIIPDWFEC